ncbi:hypothetical protein NDU88_002683 [Pleurodeles waltl]|uniref:Uncharacterized protein n=1 Tax=Pleurodeles waltl TaxID=8319 RepID=A0AAV7WLW4_PLEWA|nr:hypothetical protein NDU88_002683 [Pleurodeles waltl]
MGGLLAFLGVRAESGSGCLFRSSTSLRWVPRLRQSRVDAVTGAALALYIPLKQPSCPDPTIARDAEAALKECGSLVVATLASLCPHPPRVLRHPRPLAHQGLGRGAVGARRTRRIECVLLVWNGSVDPPKVILQTP